MDLDNSAPIVIYNNKIKSSISEASLQKNSIVDTTMQRN